MSLKSDLAQQVTLHVESLATLHTPRAGLEPAFMEATDLVDGDETAITTLRTDPLVSPFGKRQRLEELRTAAEARWTAWRLAKDTPLAAQVDRLTAQLEREAAAQQPAFTEGQISRMADRLTRFDEVEIRSLYASATDAEKLLIERAAEQAGRQPRRRQNGDIGWDLLLDVAHDEAVTAMRAARLERANPTVFAELEDLGRIRATYQHIASGAKALVRSL